MTTSLKSKKLRNKVVFLTSSILFSVLAAGSILVYANFGFSPDPKTVDEIRGNYASTYGVSELSSKQETAISGINSTTLSFSVKEPPATPLTYSTTYITNTINDMDNPGVVNLIVDGVSRDNKYTLKMDYYAASEDDYNNDEFKKVNNITSELLDMEAKRVEITSTPTISGGRSTEAVMYTEGFDVKSYGFQSLWTRATNAIQRQGDLESGDVYSLKLVNIADEDSPRADLSISAFFYSPETLAAIQNIDLLTWTTLTSYSIGDGYSFMGLQEVSYVVSPKPTTSKITLTIAGAQPDEATVNALFDRFKARATADKNVNFPFSGITSLKYTEAVDEAYTEYSTNIAY